MFFDEERILSMKMILSKTLEDRSKAQKTFASSKKGLYGNIQNYVWSASYSSFT